LSAVGIKKIEKRDAPPHPTLFIIIIFLFFSLLIFYFILFLNI
jgi:hypothetical protein